MDELAKEVEKQIEDCVKGFSKFGNQINELCQSTGTDDGCPQVIKALLLREMAVGWCAAFEKTSKEEYEQAIRMFEIMHPGFNLKVKIMDRKNGL